MKEPIIKIHRGFDDNPPDQEILRRASFIIGCFRDGYKSAGDIELRVMRETLGWDLELDGEFWNLKRLPPYANIRPKTPKDNRL